MKTILIVLVLFQSILILSQSTPRVILKDNALWLGYYNTIKFNAMLSLNSDIQFHTKNELKNNSQALLRTGMAFKINDKLNYEINNKLSLQIQYTYLYHQKFKEFIFLDINVLSLNIYHTISL